MESKSANDNFPDNKAIKKPKISQGLTPRELIHYHMNNPDEPINDEDIENLVLHTYTPDPNAPIDTKADAADNRMLNDKEIKQAEGNSVTTSYDILGDCD